MYRLLIVDDEEIITDGLYEVFSQWRPEQLDVYKAYSSEEALQWMSRTRFDILLTDIAMPEMNGLELVEHVQRFWPRCRVVFLTGHHYFDYAYRAFQMPHVRYLLKTEGYDKVTEVIEEVIDELDQSQQVDRLLQQSRAQSYVYEFLSQGEYMRHLLQSDDAACFDRDMMAKEFEKLGITLDPRENVHLVLGRLFYPSGLTYSERSEKLFALRVIWEEHLSEKFNSLGIVDRYGDVVWFLQPYSLVMKNEEAQLLQYLEGTLEQIQAASLASSDVEVGFTLANEHCRWESIHPIYDRLRKLQQFKIGESHLLIMRDYPVLHEKRDDAGETPYRITERLAMHLEAGRESKFFASMEEITTLVLQENHNMQRMIESYYSIAIILYSYISRFNLFDRMEHHEKLLRLDDHPSLEEGFQYLKGMAQTLFEFKQHDDRDRATQVIDRICQFIDAHLDEDLSLVRLAEIHYFNPSYLSYFFKQEFGMNLSDYIDQCRLRKAKKLLSEPHLKIWEVAIAVGYDAAHSFTRFFKRHTGMTPKEYRETLALKY